MRPTDSEAGADAKLLGSEEGVLIIAWLWPSLSVRTGIRSVRCRRRGQPSVVGDTARHSQELSAETVLEAATVALDRQRRNQLGVAATRFRQIIGSTARAVDRSEEDLMTHLKWSVPLSQLELARLLFAHSAVPVPGHCQALQSAPVGVHRCLGPRRSATPGYEHRPISPRQQDLRSPAFAHDRRSRERRRRLPRRLANAEQAEEPDSYLAPRLDGRYWSLYEALASEPRDSPDYTLAELDGILVDAGEPPLPDSARKDRSWWAGNGARTEGHPQIRAWWAAGYRIRDLAIDLSSDRVASVGFEALPGRTEWLANPGRIAQREYRVPGPDKIEI